MPFLLLLFPSCLYLFSLSSSFVASATQQGLIPADFNSLSEERPSVAFADYSTLKSLESPEQLYASMGIVPPDSYVLDPMALAGPDGQQEAPVRLGLGGAPLEHQVLSPNDLAARAEARLEQSLLEQDATDNQQQDNGNQEPLFAKKTTTTISPFDAALPKEGEPRFHDLPFADQLYSKLYHIFGNDDTLLTMEWPGRVLDETTFKYVITDSYSGFLKPVAVRDAEFSIADELFPPAQITGGNSGDSLATMYRLVLDELTESTDYPAEAFRKRRESILKELAKEYKGPDGDMTLREIHTYYLNKYVQLKSKLQAELNLQKNKARLMTTPKPDMDFIANSGLSMFSDTKEEIVAAILKKDAFFEKIPILNDKIHQQLNAAWKDLIIEGRHHEVMSMLSILDVASPGELLQETKDRMRNTGISSLDGTEVTYPVWFQPRDWASSLSTKFTTRDLLLEPDTVMMEIASLQDQKEAMLSELTSLQDFQEGEPDSLARDVQSRLNELNNARNAIDSKLMPKNAMAILDAVCQTVPDCIVIQGPDLSFDNSLLNPLMKLDSKPGILFILNDPSKRKQLAEELMHVIELRLAYRREASRYADMMNQEMLAKTTDFKARQITLSRKIRALEVKIQQQKALMAGARKSAVNPKDEPMTPTGSSVGPWMDVVMVTSQESAMSETKMAGFTKSKATSGWFSKKRSESSASTSSAATFTEKEEWKIGFSATKVTMDRGGWFKPEFMQHSDMFMKNGNLKGKRISPGRPATLRATNNITNGALLDINFTEYEACLFPVFPIAFILVRDVTIKMTFTQALSREDAGEAKQSASKSESILGFSKNKNSASEAGWSSSSSYADAHYVIIRIPGPQILAWIQRFIAEDLCEVIRERDVTDGGGPANFG
eukprot:gb/GEZN01001687.1/.p1 GENE.gb/GEZN01001687.1/~~gb/GEZN01001687.1/.p1  ORF type:complete len:891 (+),score=126.94 gb/GEZN01001687.1/:123-2795(+)